jgi:hypothetical protein
VQDCCSRYWIVANEEYSLPVHREVLQGSEADGLTPKEYFKKIYGMVVLDFTYSADQINNFFIQIRIHDYSLVNLFPIMLN